MQYCGIDMGKKSSHFYIVNEKRQLEEKGTTKNRVKNLERTFGNRASMKIVVEASTKSFWMADRLEELGHNVIVVDPGRTKAIGAARIKHDKLDARVLAELCAADLLAKVARPTEEQRLERMTVTTRDGLVKARVKLMTMVRSILDSEGIEMKKCAADNFVFTMSYLFDDLPETMQNSIRPVLTSIDALTEQINECDEQLKESLAEDEEVKRLMTVPGVGILVAACFISAIRDPGRFQSGRQVGAYLGLVPSLYQSGNVFVRGRITKCGNRQARWMLCIAANALLRTRRTSALKEWGIKLVARVGRKKGIIAIARKLASVMWSMMKKKTEFEYRLASAQ